MWGYVKGFAAFDSRSLFRCCLCILLGASATMTAEAGVRYTVSDLPDVTLGEDLWHYSYRIDGPLPSFGAANIFFGASDFANLALTGFGADVSPLLVQPDPSLGWDGQLTATLLSPLGIGGFETVELDFVWLGVGSPTAQSFELLDDSFNVIGGGSTRLLTSSSVSEPGAVLLLMLGLAAMRGFRRQLRSS